MSPLCWEGGRSSLYLQTGGPVRASVLSCGRHAWDERYCLHVVGADSKGGSIRSFVSRIALRLPTHGRAWPPNICVWVVVAFVQCP